MPMHMHMPTRMRTRTLMQRFLMLAALLQLAALLPFAGGARAPMSAAAAEAEAFPTDAFASTWARTDQPVRDSVAVRTWMWGPQPGTYGITEPYAEADSGRRSVQYYDKSRMEITDIHGDPSSPWYVTNGLLVVELMTGDLQVGDHEFESYAPSIGFVAGDMDAAEGITYAALAGLRDAPATPVGQPIIAVLSPDNEWSASVSQHAPHAALGVTAAHHVDVPGISYSVASPFWQFMNSSGTVWDGGGYANAPLFQNPFYATGLPITEAYWTTAQVGGNARLVLLQCFERRCLTYTPDNPAEWQVEAGNVGLHYRAWRYGDGPITQDGPSADANAIAHEIVSAENANDRFHPLADLANMLGLGVMYGDDGSLLTNGRIRSDGDFYLYVSELRLLAEAYDRHDILDLSGLGTDLGSLLFGNIDAELSPEFVRDLLHQAALHAHANPDDPAMLPLLVVRQLGLAASVPYDIFSPDPLPITALQLDAVQQWLLLTDVLLPLLEPALPLADTFTPGETCATPWNDTSVHAGHLGHQLHAAIGDQLNLDPAFVLSGYHALLLGKALQVTPHAGSVHGNPGGLMTFGVNVQLNTVLSDHEFRCGWLRTEEPVELRPFPQGPVADVAVHWLAFNLLDAHGNLECPSGCIPNPDAPIVLTHTDDAGNSTLPVRVWNGLGASHGIVLVGVGLGLPLQDPHGHLPGDFPVRWVSVPWTISGS